MLLLISSAPWSMHHVVFLQAIFKLSFHISLHWRCTRNRVEECIRSGEEKEAERAPCKATGAGRSSRVLLPRKFAASYASCSAGAPGLIPGLGRSPEEGNGSPLQYYSFKIPRTEEPGGLQAMESEKVKTQLSNYTTTIYYKDAEYILICTQYITIFVSIKVQCRQIQNKFT